MYLAFGTGSVAGLQMTMFGHSCNKIFLNSDRLTGLKLLCYAASLYRCTSALLLTDGNSTTVCCLRFGSRLASGKPLAFTWLVRKVQCHSLK